jgi:hypothetical protein
MRDIDTLTRAWLGGLLTLTELTEQERRRIHTRVLALAIADARHAEIVASKKAAAAAEPVPVNMRNLPPVPSSAGTGSVRALSEETRRQESVL